MLVPIEGNEGGGGGGGSWEFSQIFLTWLQLGKFSSDSIFTFYCIASCAKLGFASV